MKSLFETLAHCVVVLAIAIVPAFLVPVSSSAAPKETERERAKSREQAVPNERNNLVANYIIRKITYIKDPRTGICFSYMRESTYTSFRTILTTVPCEKIPPELLVTANPYLINK